MAGLLHDVRKVRACAAKEYLDQELVGRLAEKWAAGTSFGARIDSLLERLVKFLEALRNALRGMGFQTADDVFEKVFSGAVAIRPEGERREPPGARERVEPRLSTAPVPGAQPGRREPTLGRATNVISK